MRIEFRTLLPLLFIAGLISTIMDLEITMFSTNTQPYYVLIDLKGKPLAAPRGHNLDVGVFIEWLDAGLSIYSQD